MDQHLKRKMHLDNVKGEDKDNNLTKDKGETSVEPFHGLSNSHTTSTGYCDICNTKYDKKLLTQLIR